MSQLSLDKMVHNSASVVLQNVIDKVIGEAHSGDVHAMRQFRYAVGLVPNPDPLTTVTVEDAQNKVLEYWDFLDIVNEYKHNLPLEFALEWLKTKHRQDFGPQYLTLCKEMISLENQLIEECKIELEKQYPFRGNHKSPGIFPLLSWDPLAP